MRSFRYCGIRHSLSAVNNRRRLSTPIGSRPLIDGALWHPSSFSRLRCRVSYRANSMILYNTKAPKAKVATKMYLCMSAEKRYLWVFELCAARYTVFKAPVGGGVKIRTVLRQQHGPPLSSVQVGSSFILISTVLDPTGVKGRWHHPV